MDRVIVNTKGWFVLIGPMASAATGFVVMAIAIFTGSTVMAVIAIAIAILGLLLLAKDWRKQHRARAAGEATDPPAGKGPPNETPNRLEPEMFEPDVSYEEATESADDTEVFDFGAEGTGNGDK